MPRFYLLISERGINTVPVRADSAQDLTQVMVAEARGAGAKVAAVELLTYADIAADGTVPQAFLDGETNRATLVTKARAALNANAAFLALANPTSADVRDQVRLLTRECSALIRLLLGQVESTDGT